MRQISRILAAAAIAAIPFATGSAQSITSITATFANAVPGSNTSINNDNPNLIQVCWPDATSGANCSNLGGEANNVSGYTFAPAGTPFDAIPGSPFQLGTFTHINYPVSLASPGPLTSVQLLFSFDIAGHSISDSWTLTHEETPNTAGTCIYGEPGDPPCPDRVSFSLTGGNAPTPFSYNGVNYILTLFGFGDTASEASVNPAFITQENFTNTTQLWAQITEVPPTNTVPEPATMTLLATGLAGMAAARKRRKS